MVLSAPPLCLTQTGSWGASVFLDLVTRIPATEQAPSVARNARVRALVDNHFSFVWRYLRGLGVPAGEVDDAAQQVFVIASQKVDSIQEGAERSFLVGTSHGVAANARRREVRRREVAEPSTLEMLADDGPNAEANAGRREELAVLDGFLGSLPEDLREIFILFELEGLTMAQIAEDLALPPGTVASRLRRGREEFQEVVKRWKASQAHGRGR
jgi:RNA polymerase sigma-70 factor (ECF subfamily)